MGVVTVTSLCSLQFNWSARLEPSLNLKCRVTPARRVAFKASGLRPIAWIDTLAHGETMGLFAELVAISLNVREARTNRIRHAARAQAVEIAELCAADISAH